MARPTIYDRPMTAAERMQRHRALQRRLRQQPLTAMERHYLQPVRVFVRSVMRCSERHYYHHLAFQKHKLIKWDDDILNGKYGRVGIEFLAEVCQYGDASAQRAVRDRIKRKGAASGRALWQELIKDAGLDELLRKHAHRRYMRAMARRADYEMGLRERP